MPPSSQDEFKPCSTEWRPNLNGASSGSGELPNPLEGNVRYEKIKDLGKGSQGFVLLANDRFTNEPVAIKFLPRGLAGIERVKRELLNHRRFWHAHVIQFYEVFLTKKFVCIVMEYAPGGSLSRFLTTNVLTEDEARFFFQQLIFAVRYCHYMRVANRDIKLENTLLDSENKLLKLCDFGLSKRSDVWCCGVMLYAMLFRCFPFERPEDRQLGKKEAMFKLMDRIVNGDWQVPPGQTISEECLDLLTSILEPDPTKRMTMEGIISHPWYRSGLPYGADNQNYPPRPEEGLQTVISIAEILHKAQKDADDDVDDKRPA